MSFMAKPAASFNEPVTLPEWPMLCEDDTPCTDEDAGIDDISCPDGTPCPESASCADDTPCSESAPCPDDMPTPDGTPCKRLKFGGGIVTLPEVLKNESSSKSRRDIVLDVKPDCRDEKSECLAELRTAEDCADSSNWMYCGSMSFRNRLGLEN